MFQYPILFGIVWVSKTFQDYVTFLPFQFDSEFNDTEKCLFWELWRLYRVHWSKMWNSTDFFLLLPCDVPWPEGQENLEGPCNFEHFILFILKMLNGNCSILMPLRFDDKYIYIHTYTYTSWQISASASSVLFLEPDDMHPSCQHLLHYHASKPDRMMAWVYLQFLLLHTDCSSFSHFPHQSSWPYTKSLVDVHCLRM